VTNALPVCAATCGSSAGEVADVATVHEFFDRIVGSWLICEGGHGAFGTIPSDAVGVEYAAPAPFEAAYGTILQGKMYFLVDGEQGPLRGSGFDYQLTYDVGLGPEDAERPSQLNMHPTPNSGFGGSFRYSPCPEQWEISGGSVGPGERAVLVRVK
jgi:hypothetical protein